MKYFFRVYLPVIIMILLASSCTSTKKLIYLQDNLSDASYAQDNLLKSVLLRTLPYHLKPQDRLLINVFTLTEDKVNFFKKPEFEVMVNDKNEILLPVIGALSVKDMTVKETEEKLTKVVSEYLKSPNITVKLLNYNITVLGEVNKQGSFTVAEPTITILNAIGTAGGVTENANMKNVRVIRNENDTARIYEVNILEDNLLSSDNYFLQPNDVVLVNPMKSKSSNQQKATTISLVFSMLTTLALIFIKAL